MCSGVSHTDAHLLPLGGTRAQTCQLAAACIILLQLPWQQCMKAYGLGGIDDMKVLTCADE